MATRSSSKRGFAAMDPERRRRCASLGGSVAHERGTGHEFSSDEARQAGSKGGKVVGEDRRYMSAIGKKGALARLERRAALARLAAASGTEGEGQK